LEKYYPKNNSNKLINDNNSKNILNVELKKKQSSIKDDNKNSNSNVKDININNSKIVDSNSNNILDNKEDSNLPYLALQSLLV
jgi:hypothetical protein